MPTFFETHTGPLFAAEFDYFRIPRARWEFMLTRLQQLGVGAVSLNIPWGFHEFKQGTVDLDGTTLSRRDLVEVLALCCRFGLYGVLNPGPYLVKSGLLADGLPPWLPVGAAQDERLMPAVQGWFKVLATTLGRYQWPDGPVIALRLDEIPETAPSPMLDTKLTQVKWPIWLRKHYEGIEALNAAYGTEYATVSDVAFPETWARGETPLEKDALAFLEEEQGDTVTGYPHLLRQAGWHVPVYDPAEDGVDLPPLRSFDMSTIPVAKMDFGAKRSRKTVLIVLQRPIRIDYDPVDVSRAPLWAELAPIRSDGSVRAKFGELRQAVWERTMPKAAASDGTITIEFKNGLLSACRGDAPLKIETDVPTGSPVYRLGLNGELVVDERLKVSRGKLSGVYLAEDDLSQTDFVFTLSDAAASLPEPVSGYLKNLLQSQAGVLRYCADQAEYLSQMLSLSEQPESEPARPKKSGVTSYTIAEARRGLREADAALRKAMASISGLEGGFGVMLDKEQEFTPQPAEHPLTISPEVFEGQVQERLVDAGTVCAGVAPQLKSAADHLKEVIDSNVLTIYHYQKSYALAVETTRSTRAELLEIVAQLRLGIASERLPLVVWRIHDQIQSITESLRWGVLRR